MSASLQTWLIGAAELEPLPDRQRFVAMLLALGVLGVVFELVRRRKLREEYSWVWVGTALLLLVLAWYQDLLISFSRWIGSASTVSTLFFGAFLFLLALVLQFSVRLSRLTHRHRTLGQRFALLEQEVARLRAEREPGNEREPVRASDEEPLFEPATRRRGDRDEVA